MLEDEDVTTTIEKAIRVQRVFINLLDTFSSRNIGKYLSNCVIGASLEDIIEEEEEENESKSGQLEPGLVKQKEGAFQVVGTVSQLETMQPEYATETYYGISREDLLLRLMECDIIIYNISETTRQVDEAVWAVSALNEEISHFEKRKMFILVSTVMTWARSKPLDMEDSEIPLTEEDYRRRKNHPNFQDHINAEKLVLKLGKNVKKLITYVVASGLQYGLEGGIFHTFFKMAWMGEVPALPVYGDGLNYIPAIHIMDLAAVIQNVIDHMPKAHYLLAVDESVLTLEDIIKCISKNTGTGKIQKVPKENAFLIKDLRQESVDQLLINLRMEAAYVKENFNVRWISHTGFVENINTILKEYKQTRRLLPIKICMLGPPAVGKSSVAEALCRHYKLHHIKLKEVISETIAKLEAIVAPKVSSTPDDESEEEEEEENVEEAQELLDAIKESLEQNAGHLEDQYIIRFVREKLKSMPCKNQGYVLDGYPKTYDQARELFNQFVCLLDASDEFLKDRVINLPESLVVGTHYTQDRFLRALGTYRDINTEDETVLNYFDELELHPIHIDIGKLEDPQNKLVIKQLIKEIGEPRNYGLTEEEKEEEERRAAEAQRAKEAAEAAEKMRKEALEMEEKQARREEWSKRLEEVKREERELLEAQSLPLRNYLMTYVMPTLIQGLNECCRARPEDPVDFLAEYLFKNNPETK
ncbi:adenylate kinase 7 isoform X3 [Suncus etruscus]|uniref:adenylate kinase 7 isoform X3 n=1 Tax=Suncus etruscus TaxID=109475 RepID=UPI00210F90FC|nr:adenylate kinase 7 isoform X3 [Suncus etruscus]